MTSRNTSLLAGFAVGSMKAGDSATAFSDGTVRPDLATIVWPSAELANSMNLQVAALLPARLGHAVGVGVEDAGALLALRQRRHVPVEAADLAVGRHAAAAVEEHAEPAVLEAGLAVLGLLLDLVRRDLVGDLEVDEPLRRRLGLGRVQRQPRGRRMIVDQIAAGLPDERRQAEDRGFGAQAELVGAAVAVGVAGQRLGGGQEIGPGPVGRRDRRRRPDRRAACCSRRRGWTGSAGCTSACRASRTAASTRGRTRSP